MRLSAIRVALQEGSMPPLQPRKRLGKSLTYTTTPGRKAKTPTARRVAVNIYNLMTRAKLTSRELAEALNVHCSAPSKWIAGSHFPVVIHLPALANVLGCSIIDLFEGVGK